MITECFAVRHIPRGNGEDAFIPNEFTASREIRKPMPLSAVNGPANREQSSSGGGIVHISFAGEAGYHAKRATQHATQICWR